MASVTVTVRKYDIRVPNLTGLNLVGTGSFTYTPSSTKYTFGVRGITFDGGHLIFSTTRSTGSQTSSPKFLLVDPRTYTLLGELPGGGPSSSRDILDIQWTPPAGFVSLVAVYSAGVISDVELWIARESGHHAGTIATGLSTLSRGVTVIGSTAWVSYATSVPGTVAFALYDLRSGTLLGTRTAGTSGNVGSGIVHIGDGKLWEKYDPGLGATRVWTHYDVRPWLLQSLHINGADNATEQGPITWDGAYLYEFDSSV